MPTLFWKKEAYDALTTAQWNGMRHACEEISLGDKDDRAYAQEPNGGQVWALADDPRVTLQDAAILGTVWANRGSYPTFSTAGTHAEVYARNVTFCANHGIVDADTLDLGESANPYQDVLAAQGAGSAVQAGNGLPGDWEPYYP
jgi:hypothetical protein